jgi:Cyclin M transmembrane N-terminal domain
MVSKSSKNNDGSSLGPPSIAEGIVASRQNEDARNGWICSKRVVSFLIVVLSVVTATFSVTWSKSTRHSMRNLRGNDMYLSMVVSNRLSLDRSLQEISNNSNITGGNNTDVCTVEYCTQNYEQEICSTQDDSWISAVPVAVQVLITIILLATSALFSGLTLGLLSLDVTGLEIIMAGDDPKQAQYAKNIYPIRKHGNLLLCTLLLGNVSVNSLVSIFLAAFTGGTVGFLTSTVLLLLSLTKALFSFYQHLVFPLSSPDW